MTETTQPVEVVSTPVGISETKEAMIATLVLAQELAKLLKDGFQVTDLTQFYTDLQTNEDFKTKLLAAYAGYKNIPAEVKDIDVEEGFELAAAALPEVLKLIKSFKK